MQRQAAGFAALAAGSLLLCIGLAISGAGALSTAGLPHDAASLPEAPRGYRITLEASGFRDPAGLTADAAGTVYIALSGLSLPGESGVLVVGSGIAGRMLGRELRPPVTGVTWHSGTLYVTHGRSITALHPDSGAGTPVIEGLPVQADHRTTAVAVGRDGLLYFGVGSATNSGVVGPDNIARSWVARHPDTSDIPCRDLKLRGTNFTSLNLLTPDPEDRATTGAFLPYGTPSARGQAVGGAVPCTAALLRVRPDGTALDLVAWGLRASTAPVFAQDGRLWVAVRGMEARGSRPVSSDPDALYLVQGSAWYGWPDYTNDGQPLGPVLLEHPQPKPAALALLGHGTGVADLVFPPTAFGLGGEALAALENAGTVVRIGRDGRVTPFLQAPEGRSFHPVGLALAPDGSLLVLDRGQPSESGAAEPGEADGPGPGRLWRVRHAPKGVAGSTGPANGDRLRWGLVGMVLTCAGTALTLRLQP
jgi:glucose/arabinose dehydrogenase